MAKLNVHQNPVTIITEIKPGHFKILKENLEKIKKALIKNEYEDFESIGKIHYARWVIIDDKDEEGNPEQEKAKLVFSSNFDGSKEDQIKSLCTIAQNTIDIIYESCVGYPSQSERTLEKRYTYLFTHDIPASSFYRGSPNRSLQQIRDERKLRNYLRAELDSRSWDNLSAKVVHKALLEAVNSKSEFDSLKEPFEMPNRNLLVIIILGVLLLTLSPLIILHILLVQFAYERKDRHFKKTRSELNDWKIKELEAYEDLQYQNQFTQLVVMKSGIVRLITFKALMLFSKVLIKYLFVEGKLMGIPTIHFARWVLFDKNKRVLFFSNFDGNWQQYLGDFIDKSGWGLTGIFSNTTNFPKTRFLFWGGAYDEEHFLAWSRNTELQTQVWYNAYPDLSIKNINNNSIIRSELFKDLSEKKAQEFLKLL